MVRLFVLLSVLSLSAPATLAANGYAIKQRADAVLTLMSYTVVPDVTASDLNIGSGSNDKHNLAITQFGGGATLSESFPLYLEGTMVTAVTTRALWSAMANRRGMCRPNGTV